MRNKSGIPYVYPHHNGWRVRVWSPQFKVLINLGSYRTQGAAQKRAEAAIRIIGSVRGKRLPKPACPNGHYYTAVTTFWWRRPDGEMGRRCRICARLRHQKSRAKKREALLKGKPDIVQPYATPSPE